MRSQKKATKEARAHWATAVSEGRVLKFGDGSFKSYLTVDDLDRAFASAVRDGYPVAKVSP